MDGAPMSMLDLVGAESMTDWGEGIPQVKALQAQALIIAGASAEEEQAQIPVIAGASTERV